MIEYLCKIFLPKLYINITSHLNFKQLYGNFLAYASKYFKIIG